MNKTEETEDDWNPTCERFVACLDILGFKDRVANSTHGEIYQSLEKFSQFRDIVESTNLLTNSVKVVLFSDSIFIFSKDNSVESFDDIVKSTSFLLNISLRDNVLLPLKGSLAYGKLTVDTINQIYFGQALIDAYLLEQEIHYLGVVTHHSFEKFIIQNKESLLKSNGVDKILPILETPLKSSNVKHRNFNIRKSYIENLKNLEKLYLNVSGKPRIYIDNTFKVLEQLEKINLNQEN